MRSSPSSPAQRLVFAGAVCDIVTDLRSDLDELLEGPEFVNYDEVRRIAKRHKVFPVIAWNLSAAGLLVRIPERDAENMLDDLTSNARRNSYLHAAARSLVERLAAAGVEVLIRKGLPLADRAYGNLALRAIADIDLLVRKREVRDLVRVLRELRYEASMSQEAQRMLVFGGLNYPTMSRATGEPVCPDLHVGISVEYFERAYACPYDIEKVFERAAGTPRVRGLPVADDVDFFIDVCAHFFKDAKSLASIEWGTDLLLYRFSDVARLARAFGASGSWPKCIDRVAAAGLATPVNFALSYTRQMDPAAVPLKVIDRLGPVDASFLHSYGESERKPGLWPDQDVLARTFDERRAVAFRGSSEWAAMAPAEASSAQFE